MNTFVSSREKVSKNPQVHENKIKTQFTECWLVRTISYSTGTRAQIYQYSLP